MAGMLGGGAASGTGVLTLPGVAAVVGSAALVAGGIANVKAGAERLGQALSMSSGNGSSGPQGKAAVAEEQGPRRPSARQRDETFERSKDGGAVPRCTYCGKEITRQPGRPDTYETDHRVPYSRGGPTRQENLEPSCRTCNRSKGPKTPDEWGGP